MIPSKFKITPWSHQLKTIKEVENRNYFALFYEMGGGKTLVAVNIMRQKFTKHGRFLKTLILCPVIVKENWKREIEMNSHMVDTVQVLEGAGKKRIKQLGTRNKHVFITNIESCNMKDLWDVILKFGFECLIVDESHRFKNPTGKRTTALLKLVDQPQIKYRFILTGSAILNSPLDIWAQMRILSPEILSPVGKSFWAFRDAYFYNANKNKGPNVTWPAWTFIQGREDDLNSRIYSHAHRVLKDDVLDIPPMVYQEIPVELSVEQKKLYIQMKQDFIAFLENAKSSPRKIQQARWKGFEHIEKFSETYKEGEKIKGSVSVATLALTKALRLQQLVSGIFVSDEKVDPKKPNSKYKTFSIDNKRNDVLKEILEDIPKSEKVIIWAVFRDSYHQIYDLVLKTGRVSVFLTGEQNYKEKNEAVDMFNNNEAIDVIIANPNAGGTGVNLTAASYMIYYSRNFSLEADIQSEARAHRGGQTKKVTRIDMVARGTIDQEILAALKKKMNMSEMIMGLRGKL